MEWRSEFNLYTEDKFIRISRGLNKLVTDLIDKEYDHNEQETSETKAEALTLKTNVLALEELTWTPKSKSSTSTPKNQLADILTRGNFTRDEWNHLLCLFKISHFSFTVCSDTMAKQSQQDSGEGRVTAKSRPMMNLIVRTPSFVSSSTSVSPGKKHYGSQDPWKSVVADDRSGRPGKGTDLFEASDHHFHEPIHGKLLCKVIQIWMTTVIGLLKSGKLREKRTIDQGDLIKLLGEW